MVCPPLWWCCVQGACAGPCFFSQPPAFAPSSSEVALGLFWFLFILLSRICPDWACTQLFLVPYKFLCILLLEEMFVQVQALQQKVPGPSLSHLGAISPGKRPGRQDYIPSGHSEVREGSLLAELPGACLHQENTAAAPETELCGLLPRCSLLLWVVD